jgi:hypothetical protein
VAIDIGALNDSCQMNRKETSRQPFHHRIQPRYLLACNRLRTARHQRNFVRKEIGKGIGANRNSQSNGHAISPAEVRAHHHQEERQHNQQKCCS